MTDLILSGNSNQTTMSSREIAELIDKRHDHVIRDIRAMLVDLEDTPNLGDQFSEIKDARGYTRQFDLDRELTETLVTGYSVQLRHRVIKRLNELLSQPLALPDFSNPAAAARAWADEVEIKQAALVQLERARPALEFVKRFVTAPTGAKGFQQVCKLLDAKQPAFRKFLVEKKIMYLLGGEWAPYQQHIDAGRFVIRAGVAKNDHAYNATKFTPKGVEWIAGKWAINNLQGDL